MRARRGLKLERRARTYSALPRTQGTEGTERKGLDTRNSKILGEFYHFYHKKTVNKKRVETKEGIQKKNLGTKKNIQTSSRQNKKRATRSLCRRPTTRRIRREHVNARERYRTHALRCGQTACNPVGNTQRFALVGLCAPRIGFAVSVG